MFREYRLRRSLLKTMIYCQNKSYEFCRLTKKIESVTFLFETALVFLPAIVYIFISIIRDGQRATALFIVLYNVLQQLRLDKEIDVLTAVRRIQSRNPNVFTTLVNKKISFKIESRQTLFTFN